MRPGARTCAAHVAAREGPSAAATFSGDPVATGTRAARVSAHRRTAARSASRDGNRTPGTTVAMWRDEEVVPPEDARGGVSSIQRGARPSVVGSRWEAVSSASSVAGVEAPASLPASVDVTAANAEPSSSNAMPPSSSPTRPPSSTSVAMTGAISPDVVRSSSQAPDAAPTPLPSRRVERGAGCGMQLEAPRRENVRRRKSRSTSVCRYE